MPLFMRKGDFLEIQYRTYRIESAARGRLVLRRQPRGISRPEFERRLKAGRWSRPGESATFLVDAKAKQTIDNGQMLALGIPSKRIEKLHRTLPLLTDTL